MQNRSKANIVLFGRTGAGKSTFINYIMGNDVAPTGCGEPVTKTFNEYEYKLRNGISIRIYDSKGLEVVGYKDAVDEVLDFTRSRSSSGKVHDWIHCIFYCINIERARLENEEVVFIKRISEIVGYQAHIIITHCRGAENAANERAMQDKIRTDLGEKVKVFCVNSVEKRMRSGEIVHQFGKELIIKELVDLLWENTSKKIAFNYAFQMRSGLYRIINGIENETINSINSAKVSDLQKGVMPESGFERSTEQTNAFITEMNKTYDDSINSFLNMYSLFINAFGEKQIKRFSPFELAYPVLLDGSLGDEFDDWFKQNEDALNSKIKASRNYAELEDNYKDSFIQQIKFFCGNMRGRIPSQAKIECDINNMLNSVKKESTLRLPVKRVNKKIGPNKLCPCGSGRKFKKCCKGKGIYD